MSPLYPLLGLLTRGKRHGYELKAIIDQEFAPFWRIDFAQLYRSLNKMAENGWVRARVSAGHGGPNRKLYTLTARGRDAFQAWLAQPARDRNEFLVKVQLANAAGIPVSHLVEPQRTALTREHAARVSIYHTARAAGDASRLVIADAALRETEAAVAALDLVSATSPRSETAASPHRFIAISGSDDPLLTRLARSAHATTRVLGSLNGLLALAQHEADLVGIHLLDPETGDYNVPFIKRLVPEDEIIVVNLAVRENGLIVARGNPKNIRGVRDLTRRGIRFINRQRGTGTRLLIRAKLRAAHIAPQSLRDWEHAASTHDAVAGAVALGTADVGPGLRAVAAEWNLDFIPLGAERYDLAIPRAEFESPRLRELLNVLHSKAFLQQASDLQGYDLARCGRVIARVK